MKTAGPPGATGENNDDDSNLYCLKILMDFIEYHRIYQPCYGADQLRLYAVIIELSLLQLID